MGSKTVNIDDSLSWIPMWLLSCITREKMKRFPWSSSLNHNLCCSLLQFESSFVHHFLEKWKKQWSFVIFIRSSRYWCIFYLDIQTTLAVHSLWINRTKNQNWHHVYGREVYSIIWQNLAGYGRPYTHINKYKHKYKYSKYKVA